MATTTFHWSNVQLFTLDCNLGDVLHLKFKLVSDLMLSKANKLVASATHYPYSQESGIYPLI